MRHRFRPKHGEIHFEWTPDDLQIHLNHPSGDTFVIELDTEILEEMTGDVLKSRGWCFERADDQLDEAWIQQAESPF